MRVLTWHFPRGQRKGPTYYMETDYQPSAVRIYVETVPVVGDLEVDIFADGASIFKDHAVTFEATPTVMRHSDPSSTCVILLKGDNAEADAEDFIGNPLSEGTWVSCSLGATGGAEDITVHLELDSLEDPEEISK